MVRKTTIFLTLLLTFSLLVFLVFSYVNHYFKTTGEVILPIYSPLTLTLSAVSFLFSFMFINALLTTKKHLYFERKKKIEGIECLRHILKTLEKYASGKRDAKYTIGTISYDIKKLKKSKVWNYLPDSVKKNFLDIYNSYKHPHFSIYRQKSYLRQLYSEIDTLKKIIYEI